MFSCTRLSSVYYSFLLIIICFFLSLYSIYFFYFHFVYLVMFIFLIFPFFLLFIISFSYTFVFFIVIVHPFHFLFTTFFSRFVISKVSDGEISCFEMSRLITFLSFISLPLVYLLHLLCSSFKHVSLLDLSLLFPSSHLSLSLFFFSFPQQCCNLFRIFSPLFMFLVCVSYVSSSLSGVNCLSSSMRLYVLLYSPSR